MRLINKNTTEAMAAANRANALKSTGPITEEGKIQASINALKHGLRAQQQGPVIPELREREEDLTDLRLQFWQSFETRSSYEAGLLEEIIQTSEDLNRIIRYETVLDRQYDRLLEQLQKSQAEGRRKRARRDVDD